MTPTWRWRLAAAGLLLALTAPVRGQSFGFRWWQDARFQRELGLTADQNAKIDAVFQDAFTKLQLKRKDLDQGEEELSKMVAANADEAAVTRQVDKVEGVRAHMNKTRTLMLLHERQILTPDQRIKLNKLYEQWTRDHAANKPRGER